MEYMINAGIYGYGNLGRGVECALRDAEDMNLYGVFTRRDPESVKTVTGADVFRASDILSHKGKMDVLIICGGSATDLPVMTPKLAEDFNVVDSFDNHHHIPEHFENVEKAALSGNNVAVISGGWDPGLFSLARLYFSAFLPKGEHYTFWGKGVSQGHSDAIRRIPGVKGAKQYTVPVPEAVERVRNGENPCLSTREKHTRECYVAVEEGADKALIEETIKTMPDYFADYDTTVNFVSMEELKREHAGLPHGGSVIRSGFTGFESENLETAELSLKLDSNPEFTGSVITALARAAVRMNAKGEKGCFTVFDIAPALLSPLSSEELRKNLL